MQIKNQKKRRQRGKSYHMRNITSREVYGRTNELTHALLTENTRPVAKALWLTE